MPGDPFDFTDLPRTPFSRAAVRVARPLLDRMFALGTLRELYRRAQLESSGAFATRALNALKISTEIDDAALVRVPPGGPLVVVSNHPHGALDGLVLADAIARVRPDLKVLANRLLGRIPELRELCLFVDPFGGCNANARSRGGLRAAQRWLADGHALVAFPAGEVAHVTGPAGRRTDSPWALTVERLAAAAGATVVPVFIDGHNSALFYAAGHVHSALRTLLLPRELVRQQGRRVRVHLGEPFRAAPAPAPESGQCVVSRARREVDRLGASSNNGAQLGGTAIDVRPLAEPPGRSGASKAWYSDNDVANEIDQLPASACLVESGRFSVFCAAASDIPCTLDEIGRLREVTYRAVGEGTGRTSDLDRFDAFYTHLFVWDRDARLLAGAYRIGNVQRIVSERGVEGLYTRHLFRYDERLIAGLGPSVELGRSWIRAEYQKHSNALLMLWRGIGRLVVERQGVRVLFGPVSISARYSDASRRLLQAFLVRNCLDAPRSAVVKALHSPVGRLARDASPLPVPRTIDETDSQVARLESDGKGMPVLLRQYLKLNARLLGLSLDPEFGDALDALMMVDLADVNPAVLTRYLGPEAMRALRTTCSLTPRAA